MTYEEYAKRCRELSKAATPGPWLDGFGPGSGTEESPDVYTPHAKYGKLAIACSVYWDRGDAALIAHNRTAADVWREAFLELRDICTSAYLDEAPEECFTRAYEKVCSSAEGGE